MSRVRKGQATQQKNRQKRVNVPFTMWDLRMTNGYIKSCATSLMTSKMQIKDTVFHGTFTRMMKINKTDTIKCW